MGYNNGQRESDDLKGKTVTIDLINGVTLPKVQVVEAGKFHIYVSFELRR